MSIDFGVHNLRAAYAAGTVTCRAVIEEVLKRIAQAGDDKVWISRVPDAALRKLADALDARRDEFDKLPLYGIPFAVKDNIDVEGLATTAACPGFAYTPKVSATVVKQLVDAGATAVTESAPVQQQRGAVSENDVLSALRDHLRTLPPEDQRFARLEDARQPGHLWPPDDRFIQSDRYDLQPHRRSTG